MTLEEARHEANSSRKADFLFARGYRARRVSDREVQITAPGGTTFLVDTVNRRCTCRGYRDNGFCSHAMGYIRLMWEQAYGGHPHG